MGQNGAATRSGIGKTSAVEIGAPGEGRAWSWAASDAEADARRRDANELVGQRIRAVRYYTLDYRRHELHPELIGGGPRSIDAESEWNEPIWRYDGFDAMDYGLEVTTDSGAVFSHMGPSGSPSGDWLASLWCPRITFHGEDGHVEVVMGDSQDGALVPSADNVAVLHPGTSLPTWFSLKD